MSSLKEKNRRKHTRFKPDDTLVEIDPSLSGSQFAPQKIGLLFSESYGGCGLVLLKNDSLQTGTQFRLRLKNLDPLQAEIVWRQEIDGDVLKIGVKYLE